MPKNSRQTWFSPRRSILTLVFGFTALMGNVIVQADIVNREATSTTSSVLFEDSLFSDSESDASEPAMSGTSMSDSDFLSMEPGIASFTAMESPQADPVPEPALLPLLALLVIGGLLLAPRRLRPAMV